MNPKNHSLGRRAFSMAWVTGFSRIFGLVRSQFMAGLLGATALGDAFNIAFRFPNLMRRLFAEGAMSSGFVPVFASLVEKEGHGSSQRFFSRIFSFLCAILVGLTILVLIAAPWIIDFYYAGQAGVTPETRATAVLLFRLMFPYLLFVSLAAVLQGVLNTHHEFSIPAAAPILFNLVVIGSAAVYLAAFHGQMDTTRAVCLAIGVALGGLAQLLFQYPWVRRKGYLLGWDWAPGDPQVRRFIALVVPTVFSAGVYQLNAMLVDPLAVALGDGALSAIQYSIRLQEFPLGMVVVSLATVSLPVFSRHVASGDQTALEGEISKMLILTSLTMLPVTLFSFFYSEEIIRLVFGMGAFDAKAVALTGACFSFHIASIWFIGYSRILTNVFFALQDTRSPFWVSVAGLAANVGSALLFTRVFHWGVAGIAMAGGCSALVMAVVYLVLLSRRGRRLFGAAFLGIHLKIAAALVLPALALWGLKGALPNVADRGFVAALPGFWKTKIQDGFGILVATAVLGLCYAGSLMVLRVPQARQLWSKAAGKIPFLRLLSRGPKDKFTP